MGQKMTACKYRPPKGEESKILFLIILFSIKLKNLFINIL